jgi:diadenosine tetraphosphatase ApaH/serine/threonine PP2A family protein phosphatase
VDAILCVGDIVGYNADPDDCAALLRDRGALTIAGNHDLISIGRLGFGRCANKVIYSLKRTRKQIAPQTAAYLASLPAHRVLEERVLLVHAGVRDVEQYVVTPAQVRQNAGYLREDFPGQSVCFYGHVHVQKTWEVNGDEVRDLPLAGTVTLREDRVYFINPGSVDAARKGDSKLAEYALLDTAAWRIEFHRIAYDEGTSEAKAAAAGYRIDPWTDRYYSLTRQLKRVRAKLTVGG